jgi:hypothetical protein
MMARIFEEVQEYEGIKGCTAYKAPGDWVYSMQVAYFESDISSICENSKKHHVASSSAMQDMCKFNA